MIQQIITNGNQVNGTTGNVHGQTVVVDRDLCVVRTDSGKRLLKPSKLRFSTLKSESEHYLTSESDSECCRESKCAGFGPAWRYAGELPAPAWASFAMSKALMTPTDMRRTTPAGMPACGAVSI